MLRQVAHRSRIQLSTHDEAVTVLLPLLVLLRYALGQIVKLSVLGSPEYVVRSSLNARSLTIECKYLSRFRSFAGDGNWKKRCHSNSESG
jgi:hypothetical protein